MWNRQRLGWSVAGIALFLSLGTPPHPLEAQVWVSAGDMAIDRLGHQAIVLDDGRVLVVGGYSTSSPMGGYDTRAVEIYEPSTNAWSATAPTANGRTEHAATLLASGNVLVAGGENGNICTVDKKAELYAPGAGTWTFTGDIAVARAGATMTRLLDGRVLLAGGGNRCGSVYSVAEVYDPASGTWSSTGSMTVGRQWHSAVLLSDGRVLVAGGEGVSPFPTLSSAELYDPTSGTWAATGAMGTTRCCGGRFLARLADGRVLAAAGYSGMATSISPNGSSTEIFDPASGSWTPTGNMSVGRAGGTFSLMNDGRILAVGGFDGTSTQSSAELYDPITGTWSLTAPLATGRVGHVSAVLADGTVVATGGYFENPRMYLRSAELYEPARTVSIDIKPGSDPNCFNNDGNGVIPVAILSTAEFDATQVDPTTVALDGQAVRVVGKKGAAQAHIEDVDGDGWDDLVIQIIDVDGTYAEGEALAALTGETFDGIVIEGSDSICVVP